MRLQDEWAIKRTQVLLLSIPVAALMLCQPARSAQWDLGIGADVSIIHSDNIRLAPKGFEESDTALLLAPELALVATGDRIDADIRYRPEAYFYSNASDANEVFHSLDANMTTQLVKDALFFYGSATHSQTLESPDAPFSTTNLPILSSRVDFSVLELRPYWQQNLGFAEVLAEVSYVDAKYADQNRNNDSEFQFVSRDNIQKTSRFDLNNHSRQQGIAWGIDYIYAHIEYGDLDPWDYQQAAANLGYWFNDVLRVFGSGGVESSYENIFDPSMEDSFWEAGFQYKPNQRLDLELAAGERSFGNSMRGNLTYQFRRGRTTLSYTEAPSSRGQLGSNRRPLVSSDALDGYLDRPGDTDVFVLRRGEWQTNIELAKTDISIRVFGEAHDQRLSPTGEPLGDEEFYGAAFRLAWRLGSKSILGVDVDRVSRRIVELPVTQESDFIRFGMDFTYRLSQRFSLIAAAMHSKEDSLGLSALNYSENQLRLTLRSEF